MTRETITARSLLAGRWQVPLALVAALVGALTLYSLVPARPQLDLDATLGDVLVLEQSGDVLAAADALANILVLHPDLPQRDKARVHDRLADVIFRAEAGKSQHEPANVRLLAEHDEAARANGVPDDAQKLVRRALAQHWLGENLAALDQLHAALSLEQPPADRRRVLQALASILDREPHAATERGYICEQVLSDPDSPAAFVWWALHRGVGDRLRESTPAEAQALLNAYGQRLGTSNLQGYLEYLRAWVLLRAGRPAEAEPLVLWTAEWLAAQPELPEDLHAFGYLPALNRTLLGRVQLALDRPQEALESFEVALDLGGGPEARASAAAGRGAALAALHDDGGAVASLREAATLRALDGAGREALLADVQALLADLGERREAAGEQQAAVDYYQLAVDLSENLPALPRAVLLDRLGRACGALALRSGDTETQRTRHLRAATHLEHAAQLAATDDELRAEALWAAAEHYDEAGRLADMQRVLDRFITGRSEHPRMPRALLQMGRACEITGAHDAALAYYARIMREFPKVAEAVRARVQTASTLIAMGPGRFQAAEDTLLGLLTDGSIAPDASAYRDALLTLTDLLYAQGRYAAAIGRLGEFLTLYPNDPDALRAAFLEADAYRRSAYALRDAPPEGVSAAAATAESGVRFRRAAELYEALLAGLQARASAGLAPTEATYARLALFYRGDCLFELNEPDTLRAAVAAYRSAAASLVADPAALTAEVQIANVYLRLGEIPEAARAVERARWVLRGIPEPAFARTGAGTRGDWEAYLATVLESELFRGAFDRVP